MEEQYILDIKQILDQARQKAYKAVNTVMVEAYWLIGRRIVEKEQDGQERGEYGKHLLKNYQRNSRMHPIKTILKGLLESSDSSTCYFLNS